jgi:hypothetical protein
MRDLSTRYLGLRVACLLAAITCLSGCATFTGTITGAFTGFVDLPNDVIRRHRLSPDSGDTWLVAIVAAPIGFVGGPIFGFIKGIGLDVNAMNGTLTLRQEFGSYDRMSVWRPYSFDWNQRRVKN